MFRLPLFRASQRKAFSSPLPTMSRFPKSGKITKHLTSEKFSLFTFTFVERRSRPFSQFHIFFNQNLPSHSCLFFKRTSGKIPHGVKNFSFRNLSFYFHLDFHFWLQLMSPCPPRSQFLSNFLLLISLSLFTFDLYFLKCSLSLFISTFWLQPMSPCLPHSHLWATSSFFLLLFTFPLNFCFWFSHFDFHFPFSQFDCNLCLPARPVPNFE